MSAPAHSPVRLLAATVALAVLAAGCASSGKRPSGTASPAVGEAGQTASVTVVEGREMQQNPSISIEQYLQSRVPGLSVHRLENGDYTIRIRQSARMMSGDGNSDEPLLVLDGVAIQANSVSQTLRQLDPRDIARVEVLKDASATAMYGSRGVNGVLVIRTKKQ